MVNFNLVGASQSNNFHAVRNCLATRFEFNGPSLSHRIFSKNLLEPLLEERVEMGGGARTETAGLAASFHAVSRIFPARFSDGNEISVPFLYGRHLYG